MVLRLRWPSTVRQFLTSEAKDGLIIKEQLTFRDVTGKSIGKERLWWARQDSNLGPTDYESAALTS